MRSFLSSHSDCSSCCRLALVIGILQSLEFALNSLAGNLLTSKRLIPLRDRMPSRIPLRLRSQTSLLFECGLRPLLFQFTPDIFGHFRFYLLQNVFDSAPCDESLLSKRDIHECSHARLCGAKCIANVWRDLATLLKRLQLLNKSMP